MSRDPVTDPQRGDVLLRLEGARAKAWTAYLVDSVDAQGVTLNTGAWTRTVWPLSVWTAQATMGIVTVRPQAAVAVRTPDDARRHPTVGDVATLSDDGTTLTVTQVCTAPFEGWIQVVRRAPDVVPYEMGMRVSDWASDAYGVWTWTPAPTAVSQ